MVSSLTSSPSPLSVSVHLSPWSSKPATSSNGNASCDRCKPEMTRLVVTPPTSSSLRSLHQGLDRQCIHVGSSAQERRLIIPTHVLCSSSSTSSSPQARVSSRQDDSSSSPFMLLNVSYSSLGNPWYELLGLLQMEAIFALLGLVTISHHREGLR